MIAFLFASTIFADASPRLSIEGLARTKASVVERELPAGWQDDSVVFSRGLANLRNLGIFSKVEGSWNDTSPQVRLSEKWTTIPIAKFKSGGGVSVFTAGVFDPNVGGRFVELGAQYENRAGAHSGVTWFREPRLAGGRTLLGGDFWFLNRLREEFLGSTSRGFVGDRRMRAHLFVEPEIESWLRLHGGIEWLSDTLSPGLLALADDQKPVSRPGLASNSWVTSFGATLGRIDQDLETQQGATLESRVDVSWAGERWHRQFLEAKAFWLATPRLNLAFRGFAGGGSERKEFHDWRLGGLEQIRGLPEDYLVGDQAWYGSLEARYTVWKGDWLRAQVAGFTDAGGIPGVGDHTTWGGGIRILSPKVYRMNLRVDWANGPKSGIAAGLQQFF